MAVSRFVRAQQTAAAYCLRFGLNPAIDPDLYEFSLIDPTLIAGLDGVGRKPYINAYWEDADLHRRMGDDADTFAEFVERVRPFQHRMDTLPNCAVFVAAQQELRPWHPERVPR